ncbi:MAG: ROK family protein [Bacteroidales bacterium]|nr:ROK family protein [Bacteroidales bacterium]
MNNKPTLPIVMTLDAGGQSYVFSAVWEAREVIAPISVSFKGDDLETTLKGVIEYFGKVAGQLPEKPVAISFGFPGPCDYPLGIIGDLQNLPAFRGGVALADMLEEAFQIPVFINNDADLFAYGEATHGLLPAINKEFEDSGSPKRFHNLFGITLGTGFGGGIVSKGQLFFGDNAVAGEINRMGNILYPEYSVEESVSIRGIQRVYARAARIDPQQAPEPKEIYEIAIGESSGDKAAALQAFDEFAVVLAQSLVDAVTLVDGIIAVGGGLAGASSLFLPKVVEAMRKPYKTVAGDSLTRLESSVFYLDDPIERKAFIEGDIREITVPFSKKTIKYDPMKRIGIGKALLQTHEATSIGAYSFAINQLKR